MAAVLRIVIDNEDAEEARLAGSADAWTANAYLAKDLYDDEPEHLTDAQPGFGPTPEAALAALRAGGVLPEGI